MRNVRYDGPSDAVDILDPVREQVYTVARGDTIEVPDELAEQLLEQEIWNDPDAPPDDDIDEDATDENGEKKKPARPRSRTKKQEG